METIEFVRSEIKRLTRLKKKNKAQYIKDEIQNSIDALESYIKRRVEKN